MKNTFARIALAIAAIAGPGATAPRADTSVFDLRLNERFDVRECAYQIVSVPIGRQGILVKRTTRMYQYTETKPESGRCFQREGVGYTDPPMDTDGNANPLPAAGPVVDRDVRILYADSDRPALVGDKWVWVRVKNSKIMAVKFYFPAINIKGVQSALEKKYGRPTSVDDMYLDRYENGRLDFYVAQWNLPDLSVTLTSVDTSLDYDGARYSAGHVRIDHGPRAKSKDNNPL